ncbi:uncharacterized protein EV422DRAFT_528315 [Fimicolochytrium jonesii]|uniref:uncharacterized protein n=1 Tax=Fimicolochytrium jonesii TaxID=1396493 RepID=UPI0022FEA0EA|nr:uncharacterized protein EV422DRAFT_528315 [Fimicolochytrium jonesii]KAI8821493.1 hypothetical protein EV422DRAFT_528315 [Fimicolochytrium jonesii]
MAPANIPPATDSANAGLAELTPHERDDLVKDTDTFIASLSPTDIHQKLQADQALLDSYWADDENWSYGVFYHCKDDPRWLVPKRIKSMGWTINFASSSDRAREFRQANRLLKRAAAKVKASE